MTVGGWALFIFLAICVFAVWIAVSSNQKTTTAKTFSLFGAVIIIIGLFAVFKWYYSSTASGLRAIKSQESNFTNGIEREVTVYSMTGEQIKHYDGRFDVDYDNDRIIFDDENGKRHVIYYPTGTVIIDEK